MSNNVTAEPKRVLEAFHGPITKPTEAQILRW